jgi:hypothetical protein
VHEQHLLCKIKGNFILFATRFQVINVTIYQMNFVNILTLTPGPSPPGEGSRAKSGLLSPSPGGEGFRVRAFFFRLSDPL